MKMQEQLYGVVPQCTSWTKKFPSRTPGRSAVMAAEQILQRRASLEAVAPSHGSECVHSGVPYASSTPQAEAFGAKEGSRFVLYYNVGREEILVCGGWTST
jgi:hypothetical protein